MAKPWTHLTTLFLAALALRLAFVFGGFAAPRGELAYADEREYDAVARNIAQGKGFVDTYGRRASRAPGYPLFLAACYKVFGQTCAPVRFIQCVLGAVTALAAAALAFRLAPPAAGALCGWLVALDPFQIVWSSFILSESLFIPLLVLAVLALAPAWESTLNPERRPAWGMALAAGALLGLAVLVRSSLLLFPVCLVPLWVLAARLRRRAMGLACVAVAALAVVQVPWVWRNAAVFGRFIPATLQVGESLLEACGPGADGAPRIDRMAQTYTSEMNALSEIDRNQRFRDEALRWMRQNPGEVARLAFIKLGRFWNLAPNASEYRSRWIVAASMAWSFAIYIAALAGLAAAWRKWRWLALLLAPVLYYSGLHMIFVGSVRYRAPVMPFVMVLAAWGAAQVFCRARPAGDAPCPT
ncbi:MAG TPA: glycosyltransferase family 39 protein [Candidatus Brocadiia bacterium]|nr:glycosyltransferase family 39 protein [Candidatus Brocadiia bacterium]